MIGLSEFLIGKIAFLVEARLPFGSEIAWGPPLEPGQVEYGMDTHRARVSIDSA